MTDHPTGEDGDFGIGKIDGEHRVQLGLLAALREALTRGLDWAESDELLDRLADFTKVHFMSEELLMRLYQYPDYQAHVAEHEGMVEHIETLRASLTTEADAMTLQTLETLKNALVGHIARADRDFGDYLARLPDAAAQPPGALQR